MNATVDATISAPDGPLVRYTWRCPLCGEEVMAAWLPVYQPELICMHDVGPVMMRIVNKGARTMDYDD